MHEQALLPAEGISFNYGVLDEPTRREVLGERDQIRRRMRQEVEDVVEIGKSLIRVKEHLPHGQFGLWLDAEFGWSDRSAQNFMAVARTFPEIRNDCAIELRALYALTGDDVPAETRDELLAQGERGEVVTYEQVKQARSRPPIREVQVNVTTTRHFIEVERYVSDAAVAAYPDLEESDTLSAVDIDDDTEDTEDAGERAHGMVKPITGTVVLETSRSQELVRAQQQAAIRAMRLDRARAVLRDLLAIPPDVMASDWLIDGREGDAVEMVREMAQQLLAYADAMEAVRPQRLRLVKDAGDAS